jgi:hypothetical protein
MGGGLVTDDFVHVARLQEHVSLAHALTSPDAFGFYRPVTQLSLRLDAEVWGFNPVAFRWTNLLLHALVLGAAFLVARRLLRSGGAAVLATLAFLLTPKAHLIAVLWISGRADLLMSLFCFVALLAWTRWESGGRRRAAWLTTAAACYGLAVLSKEAAILLPVLLLLTPPDGTGFPRRRIAGCVPLLIVAGAALGLRAAAGALMPVSPDEHYNLATSADRWIGNLGNYVLRAIPSPLALAVLVGAPLALRRGGDDAVRSRTVEPAAARLAAYAAVWFLVFMVPVLGIESRSELYLYLPGFGFCLFAGRMVAPLVTRGRQERRRRVTRERPERTAPWGPASAGPGAAVTALVLVYATGFIGYQVSRSWLMRDTAVFSSKLVDALTANEALRTHAGSVRLLPGNAVADIELRNAVGGYLDTVLGVAVGRWDLHGQVSRDRDQPAGPDVLVLVCTYQDGQLVLEAVPASSHQERDARLPHV